MEEVNRPDMESNWRQFSSSRRIAWKTGTSYGFRDEWAVGATRKYTVAVWIGRPDGTPLPHEECPMAIALKGGAMAVRTVGDVVDRVTALLHA